MKVHEPQTQNITVEDVMDKLDEILEAVKNIDSKKMMIKTAKQLKLNNHKIALQDYSI